LFGKIKGNRKQSKRNKCKKWTFGRAKRKTKRKAERVGIREIMLRWRNRNVKNKADEV
jgi:hypothetical protein